MSRTYRDVLNERGVPPGPWCTYEDRTAIGDRNAERQDAEERLGPKDESDGSAPAEIAQTNVFPLKSQRTP